MLGPRNIGAGTALTVPTPTKKEEEDYFSYGFRRRQNQYHESARQTDITPLRLSGSRDVNSNSNSQLGGSAKRLISQYEKLSTPPAGALPSGTEGLMKVKSTRNRQYVHDYRAGSGNLPLPGLSSGHIKKEKSPIRQSLRNLLSVFKKGAGGLTKKKGEDEFSEVFHGHGNAIGTLQKRRKGALITDDKISGLLSLSLKQAKKMSSASKPTTGSLLYLTRIIPPGELDICTKTVPYPMVRNSTSTTCLAWSSCDVNLDVTSQRLHLSSFTAEFQFVIHEINLSGCTDIRSLGTSHLTEEELKLLDEASVRLGSELETLKLFEMSFNDGRSKERFAAKSVKERAGWISAIWDVVLPDDGELNPKVLQTPVSFSNTQTHHQGKLKPIESPTPIPLPRMSSLLSSSPSQRSLPPLPFEKVESISPSEHIATTVKKAFNKPVNLHLDIPHTDAIFSPSIYPPTSRGSLLTTPLETTPIREPRPPLLSNSTSSSTAVIRPTPLTASTYPSGASRPPSILGASPPASPSIMNLSQLSMVRQRLAQIERNHSQVSSSQSGYSHEVRPSTPVTPIARRNKFKTGNSGPPHSASSLKKGPFEKDQQTLESKSPNSMISIETTKVMSPIRGDMPLILKRKDSHRDDEDIDCPDKAYKHSQGRRNDKVNYSKTRLNDLSKRIAEVKGVLGGESGYPTIHQVVLGLEGRTLDNKRTLKTIQERIDELGSRLKEIHPSTAALSSIGKETHEPVLRAIEDVQARLTSEFPSLAGKVQELQSAQAKLLETMQAKEKEQVEVVQSNVPPAMTQNEPDLKPLVDKLDELRVLFQASQKASEEVEVSKEEPQILANVEKVLSIVQQESSKQVLFSHQQAESVRYLNELNNWLETFVNNGTSQIQGLSTNLEQLCRALGCDPRLPGVPGGGSTSNLLSDIRQLVTGMQARDQNFAALQAAVHSLLEVLSSSQVQMGAESQAIAGLVTRQRQEQETLLRTFTSEISGEIKGERLRFVEAMKEATAINVQLHVEHFKQDLSREVMAMTEEVGRLHREKQIIENQISDLFAFYSKHKQSTPPSYNDMHVESNHSTQGWQRQRASIPRSHPRPLPYPGIA